MQYEKFTNTTYTVKAILGLIEAREIAIPEIQRPFVWELFVFCNKWKVRGEFVVASSLFLKGNTPNIAMTSGYICARSRISKGVLALFN